MVTGESLAMHDLSVPTRLIITPRIQNILLSFNLKSWLPPQELCSEPEFRRIPVFSYSSRKRFVGSLLGANIASSLLLYINTDVAGIINTTEQETLAINTLSGELALTNKLIMGLPLKIKLKIKD